MLDLIVNLQELQVSIQKPKPMHMVVVVGSLSQCT